MKLRDIVCNLFGVLAKDIKKINLQFGKILNQETLNQGSDIFNCGVI